jgi:hypothetical protein
MTMYVVRRAPLALVGATVLWAITACDVRLRARQATLQNGPVQMSADTITEVSLERRCVGCERQFKLTLKRDATATRTTFGSARQGVADRTSTGSLDAAAFDELARRVQAEGFFQLLDEYRDPQTADGAWAVTTVAAGGRQKSVLDRNGMAPAALQRIQARIEDLATTVIWKASLHQTES